MRRGLSRLLPVGVALAIAVLVAANGSDFNSAPPVAPPPTRVAPPDSMAPLPESAPGGPTVSVEGLRGRVGQATAEAAEAGADIAVLLLDRDTGQTVSNGNGRSIVTASVVKLFVADDLLLQEASGQTKLSPADRESLDTMLRSSDDNVGEYFWNRSGGGAIVGRVAARYGLQSTAPPPGDGRWWNTITTPADLVRYYDMLLDGSGGLPAEQAAIIVGKLAQSTPTGIDEYPQRFGIPDGLFAEQVAVKQGWMCCIGSDWMHLSTGLIGPDRRYVLVVESRQPSDDDTARATITRAVQTMFPSGRI